MLWCFLQTVFDCWWSPTFSLLFYCIASPLRRYFNLLFPNSYSKSMFASRILQIPRASAVVQTKLKCWCWCFVKFPKCCLSRYIAFKVFTRNWCEGPIVQLDCFTDIFLRYFYFGVKEFGGWNINTPGAVACRTFTLCCFIHICAFIQSVRCRTGLVGKFCLQDKYDL